MTTRHQGGRGIGHPPISRKINPHIGILAAMDVFPTLGGGLEVDVPVTVSPALGADLLVDVPVTVDVDLVVTP